MDIKTWHPEMSHKETADLAYWERNMLALRYADGWYNDDVDVIQEDEYGDAAPTFKMQPRFKGWRRVLSLDGGAITFHIPDEFNVGNLPEIQCNWDGHTTEEKWLRVLRMRGVAS